MNLSRFYTRLTTGTQAMTVSAGQEQFTGFRRLQEEKSKLLTALEGMEPLDQTGLVFAQGVPDLYGWTVMGRVQEGRVQEFKAKYAAGSHFTRLEYERDGDQESVKRNGYYEGMTAEDLSATETRATLRGDQAEIKEFDFWEPYNSDVFEREPWIVEGRRQALRVVASQPVSDGWVRQVRGLAEEESKVAGLWAEGLGRSTSQDRLPGLVELLSTDPVANYQRVSGSLACSKYGEAHPGWQRFQRLVGILGTQPEELQNASRALAWIDEQRQKGVPEEEALEQFLTSQLPRQATSAVTISIDEEYLLVGDHHIALG